MTKKGIGIAIATIVTLCLASSITLVKAYTYYSELSGGAAVTVEWGIPLSTIGQYTLHTLKLGMKALDAASATAKGCMYVDGYAYTTGWVTGTIKWYMKGHLVAPFLGAAQYTNDAWITVKFQAIDLTADAKVEKVLLHVHADPATGTNFDGEYSGTMDIPLYDGHKYRFVLDVEVHGEVLGVVALTIADFGGVDWPDSRIEWVFIDVPSTGPPDGCPYVSTWNGEKYVVDNNLLPTSLASNGADVEDYYRLERTLVRKQGKYWLKISEFQNEHSYLDQVKLFAIDHESDVNIAVTQTGEILTYKEPFSPISCIDNNGIDRLSQVASMDGDVTDPDTHYYGETGDYLILNFGELDSDHEKLILRDDMICKICCIQVQILSDGEWQSVATIAPRDFWSIEAVDLSPYVAEDGDFMVKLIWTSAHRLDYVGLDTSDPEEFEIQNAHLVSATHSETGDVKEELLKSDYVYTELVPGEQIELTFTLPNNSEDARTFIIYVKGHYYTITT